MQFSRRALTLGAFHRRIIHDKPCLQHKSSSAATARAVQHCRIMHCFPPHLWPAAAGCSC
jgi:hypothetical protein